MIESLVIMLFWDGINAKNDRGINAYIQICIKSYNYGRISDSQVFPISEIIPVIYQSVKGSGPIPV